MLFLLFIYINIHKYYTLNMGMGIGDWAQAHTFSHTALPRKNDDDLFAEPLSFRWRL